MWLCSDGVSQLSAVFKKHTDLTATGCEAEQLGEVLVPLVQQQSVSAGSAPCSVAAGRGGSV